jgi:hypothetical protein
MIQRRKNYQKLKAGARDEVELLRKEVGELRLV